MICQLCDRPVNSGTVCSHCTGTALRILEAVPGLVKELRVTLTRRSKRGGVPAVPAVPAARTSSEQPLPFDVGASNVLSTLDSILWRWTSYVSSITGVPWRQGSASRCAGFLSRPERLELLRQCEGGGTFVADLLDWYAEATRVVDLPPERVYAGPCDLCGNDLYAIPGAVTMRCDSIGCDGTYDVSQRRAWLLGAVSDRLATTTEICTALTSLSTPVTPNVIRGLVYRGRIVAKGTDSHHHPLYRVGDVMEVLAERRAKASCN